jgi:UDP-N-acetylglucosamine--N-acetylmuramyl-(pentapeptide) pyrophosphoryl-undecaprenol N-acetylglucosamine transferase
MHKKYKILVSGGGTGGHIFPAIAIANGLKDTLKDVDIQFVGAKGKMEMEKVPQAGYPIQGLWISGLQRSLSLKNLMFPFKMISSLFEASKIISSFKPDAVIGTGGYASGPLLKMAARKNVPTFILEQNSFPGITNKWLGSSVGVIFTAYPGMEQYFPSEKIIISGSPVRKNILELKASKAEGLHFFGLKNDLPTLLIIGGSQGARRINEVIGANLETILSEKINVIWQTGKTSFAMAEELASKSQFKGQLKVSEFIYEMDMAYAASDLLVSRAGAIAIAEIIAVRKPAIFVPLPSAAEDHQTKNALSLSEANAGILITETEAEETLTKTILDLIKKESVRTAIAKNMKQFEHKNATQKIVDEVIKVIEKKKN